MNKLFFLAAPFLAATTCAPPPAHHAVYRPIIEYTVIWGPESMPVFRQCSRPAPAPHALFTPTSMQVDALMADLLRDRAAIERMVARPLTDFRIQAVGFDTTRIYLNGIASDAGLAFADWRAKPVVACGGGNHYWGMVYNLLSRKFGPLEINAAP